MIDMSILKAASDINRKKQELVEQRKALAAQEVELKQQYARVIKQRGGLPVPHMASNLQVVDMEGYEICHPCPNVINHLQSAEDFDTLLQSVSQELKTHPNNVCFFYEKVATRCNTENKEVSEKHKAVVLKHAWIRNIITTYREMRETPYRPHFSDAYKSWSLIINESLGNTLKQISKHFVYFVSADTGDVYMTEDADPKWAIPIFEGQYANSLNRLVEYVWLRPSTPGRELLIPLKLLKLDGVDIDKAKVIKKYTTLLIQRIKEALNVDTFTCGKDIREEMLRCFMLVLEQNE